jgi:hypothetical protein
MNVNDIPMGCCFRINWTGKVVAIITSDSLIHRFRSRFLEHKPYVVVFEDGNRFAIPVREVRDEKLLPNMIDKTVHIWRENGHTYCEFIDD